MRIRIFIIWCFLIGLLLLNSCIDEYWPEIDKYENLLVVDGEITNEPGPYTIKLSVSTDINNPAQNPYTDCQVSIEDNTGILETLTEIEPGVYETAVDGLQGIIGRKYMLIINAPDGTNYSSEFEELNAPTVIDSVYAEVEYRQDDAYNYDLAGYQFYLDTRLAESDSNYYMWDLQATYHYQSDYLIRWIFDGTLDWIYNTDTLYNCWKTYHVNSIFLFSTETLTTPRVEKFDLHYVNTETRELSIRYSLLVKQYSLNKDAFLFWQAIKEQNSEQGLYSKQPHQIRGNVKNLINGEEPVLGYFLVSGISEKRIFVDPPPFPVLMRYFTCTLDQADFEAYGQMGMSDPVTWPIFAIETPGGFRAVPNQSCVDCRRRGGTIIKPDFWID